MVPGNAGSIEAVTVGITTLVAGGAELQPTSTRKTSITLLQYLKHPLAARESEEETLKKCCAGSDTVQDESFI